MTDDIAIPDCGDSHDFKEDVCTSCGLDIRGVMEFTFDEGTHIYRLNGKRLTGTTTIIGMLSKPKLIPWAARSVVEYIKAHAVKQGRSYIVEPILLEASQNAHSQKRDSAAKHGTDAHAMVEEWIKHCIVESGGSPLSTVITEAQEPIRPFIEWAKENVGQFLFSERMMYHAKHWFAGTADFAYIGKDGLRYMSDFKTSSGIYGIDYFLQVAAYRFLAEALGDIPYDAMSIVRLGKDGKFEVQMTKEYAMFRDAFFACLTLYRAKGRSAPFIEKK